MQLLVPKSVPKSTHLKLCAAVLLVHNCCSYCDVWLDLLTLLCFLALANGNYGAQVRPVAAVTGQQHTTCGLLLSLSALQSRTTG